MSVPESAGSGSYPGLFGSLRSLWSVLIAVLYTRLDLATTELEEIGTHVVKLLVVSLAALLTIAMAVFFFLFFLVVLFWAHVVLVLGIVFGVCLFAAVILVLVARKMVYERPKFLGQTLAELRRDVESLRHEPGTTAVKTGDTKP